MSKNRWRLSDGGICSTTTKARAECAGGISIPLRVKRWNNTRLIYTLGGRRRRRRRRMQRRIYIIRVSFLFLKKKKRRRVKKKPWGHVRGARTIFKLVYNRNLAITACIWTWSVVVHVRTLLLLLYNRKKRRETRAHYHPSWHRFVSFFYIPSPLVCARYHLGCFSSCIIVVLV